MESEHKRMLETALEGYVSLLAASAEVGAQAFQGAAEDAEKIVEATAEALRAPQTHRQTAIEDVLVCLKDAQVRQLHAMRGASALFGMSFLSHFDKRRPR